MGSPALDHWVKANLTDLKGRYSFELSRNTFLCVSVGEFGTYLRLKKYDTVIFLSKYAWRFICNISGIITDALHGKTNYTSSFCASKGIRVSHTRDQSIVSIDHKEQPNGLSYDKSIQLTQQEWAALVSCIAGVDIALDDIIVYSTCENEWYFHKRMCGPGKLRYRLVPRLNCGDIVVLLKSFLISQGVVATVRKLCTGGEINQQSQVQHTTGCGCLLLWTEQVDLHFDTAKDKFDLSVAIDSVNTSMEWKLPDCDVTDNVLQLVKLAGAEAGNGFGSVIRMYMTLFDTLGLYRCFFK